MYELLNGKLITTLNQPFESAGYIYYYKAPDNTTKVVLFERFNEKKNRHEFEIGTFGKSDYGIIKKDAVSKESFVEYFKFAGQETPNATALREGGEETDNVITTAPTKSNPTDIVTKAHKCWCDEERELETIISVVPYELTVEQFHALTSKTDYTLFSSVKSAELMLTTNGTFELWLDSTNLLATDNLKDKWRTFTKIMLTDQSFNDAMQKVFVDMVKPKAVECAQSSNRYSSWGPAATVSATTSESLELRATQP